MSDLKIISGKGRHYSISKTINSMQFLRSIFPNAKANSLNFCLFSTSGIHGSYQTIEEEEENSKDGITFIVIHPRLVSIVYGVVKPTTKDEFDYLKCLRESSKKIIEDIG